MKAKLCLSMLAHDAHAFLTESLRSLNNVEKRFVFVRTKPWNGEPGSWLRTAEIAKLTGVKVIKVVNEVNLYRNFSIDAQYDFKSFDC